MTPRTILLIVLAVTCGGSATVGVSHLIGQSGPRTDTQSIVTAAVDMPRGTMLKEKSLTLQQWPKKLVPPGAILKIEDAVERSVMAPIVAGEPVLDAKLASKGSGRGLASMVKPGMRAFTIHTPHVAAGVGGFIMPGDKVDVLLTMTSTAQDDPTGGGTTTTLLQNVTVLAVAQSIDAPASNNVDPKDLKSVTLLVTTHQVAKLDLGLNKGVLHLSLRNPEDTADSGVHPATMADLRFHQEKPIDLAPLANLVRPFFQSAKAQKREQPVGQIHTFRGTGHSVVRLQYDQE